MSDAWSQTGRTIRPGSTCSRTAGRGPYSWPGGAAGAPRRFRPGGVADTGGPGGVPDPGELGGAADPGELGGAADPEGLWPGGAANPRRPGGVPDPGELKGAAGAGRQGFWPPAPQEAAVGACTA